MAVASTAVRFHEYGEPLDVLRQDRVEVAEPPADRVRVRVAAVGLNPADWELCRGFMATGLPRGIGLDVCGTVDAVGDGVEDVRIGDLVFGMPDFTGQPSAGVAQVAVLEDWCCVPDGLDPVVAAVLLMPVRTALWTLDLMGVTSGTTLLVDGAGGTVGFAAVQIALRRGARVLATAGPTFAAELEGFGALVTPYGDGMVQRVRELAGGPVGVALDAAPPRPGAIAALVETVDGEANRVMTISNHDEARRLGARVNIDELPTAEPASVESFMPEYAALAAAGEFRIPVARTYPLDDWRTAVALSLSGHPHGKLVLLPDQG